MTRYWKENEIRYCNTDLELQSPVDLRPLQCVFEAAGMTGYPSVQGRGGLWFANLSMGHADEPEESISQILPVIESLPDKLRKIWDACTLCEFNIGYDCVDEPWAFNQGLSSGVLGRIAAVGAA